MNSILEVMHHGELKVLGRLIDASNATLLAEISSTKSKTKVIYKPIAGERPLWDFPNGNLAHREYCAYLISEIGQFDLVPATILRDGPFGLGMVQQWIEINSHVNVVEYGQGYDPQLRKMAIFDAIINNTDRKYGHLLVDDQSHLYGCDHGVCFHEINKLRTVLWQFTGESFTLTEKEFVDKCLATDLESLFHNYLSTAEISALMHRLKTLKVENKFPSPSDQWPAVPWPPV
jgi:uncharacterized repeat protein (TIGR03843 family)